MYDSKNFISHQDKYQPVFLFISTRFRQKLVELRFVLYLDSQHYLQKRSCKITLMLFEEFAIFAIISAAYIIRLVQTYILSNSIKAEKLSAVKCTMKDKL